MLRKALVIKPTSYTIQSDPAFISIREKKNSLTFKEITTKKTCIHPGCDSGSFKSRCHSTLTVRKTCYL